MTTRRWRLSRFVKILTVEPTQGVPPPTSSPPAIARPPRPCECGWRAEIGEELVDSVRMKRRLFARPAVPAGTLGIESTRKGAAS